MDSIQFVLKKTPDIQHFPFVDSLCRMFADLEVVTSVALKHGYSDIKDNTFLPSPLQITCVGSVQICSF